MNKEEIRETLINDLSEPMMNHLMGLCLHNQQKLNDLWEIAVENHYPASWRAAWIYSKVAEKNPQIVLAHLPLIPEYLLTFNHDGQKRELLKVILLFPLENQDLGKILKICFDWLCNPHESIAVRVHSMQIVYEISKIEMDLQAELKLQLLQILPEADAGMKSRASKILQKLSSVDISNRL